MNGHHDLSEKEARPVVHEAGAHEKDLMERGFALAYFILPDRAAALQVVAGAMNRLKAQRGRETRRTYWRDKHLKRAITRIVRSEQDTLQWLIFYEADQQQQSRLRSGSGEAAGQDPPPGQPDDAGKVPPRDLVVQYISSLVRMTTAMSSFHVNIGLHRLLHNYTTAETQRAWEVITERYLGADEYRRAKSVLMTKLDQRFRGMLQTVRGQHGEMRFAADEDQARWADLVDTCLSKFTPWSNSQACPVPTNYDASREGPPARLSGKGAARTDPNEIESNRCHAFIDPKCFGRLMRGLAFDAPDSRLALPRFSMDTNYTDHNNPPSPPQRLSAEERKQITDQLSSQDKKRSGANPRVVSVLVDGAENARLELDQRSEHRFEIAEGAELIELRSRDRGEDLLLAVYPLAYQGTDGFAPAAFTLFRKGQRRLELSIVPGPQSASEPRHATVELRSTPGLLARIAGNSPVKSYFHGFKYAAGTLGLVALGWILGMATQHGYLAPQRIPSNSNSAAQPVQIAAAPQPNPVALPPATHETAARPQPALQASAPLYVLVPDEMVVRGAGSTGLPSVRVTDQPILLRLQLPVALTHAHKSFRASLKQFLKPSEIVRENMLRARKTSLGHVVVFELPSGFIEDRQDYTVDLRAVGSNGEMEDIGSYTFHAEKSPED